MRVKYSTRSPNYSVCEKHAKQKATAPILLVFLFIGLIVIAEPARAQSEEQDDDMMLFMPAILANKNSTTGTPPNVGASLCQGFAVNDMQDRPMAAMVRPAPGAQYTDAAFGSKITRITDSSALASGIIKTLYSTIQAWNADESRMVLWHRGEGHYLYDGQTYDLIEKLPVTPVDIEQLFWSSSKPDILYYPNGSVGTTVTTAQGDYRLVGNELMSYNVRSGIFSVIKDLNNVCSTGNRITAGNDAQMLSFNDDVFGLRCGGQGFSYRRSTDTTTLMPASAGTNAPQAFPSGELFYHNGSILNQQLIPQRALDLGSPIEHSNLGRLANGNDAYFAVAFLTSRNNSCGNGIGSVVVHDATNANCRVLVGPVNGYPYTLSGTHISALAEQRPGWAAVSSIGYGVEGDTLLEQEIYLVNSDPAQAEVCRIAHHRATGRLGSIGYFAEPHPILSPSGTRVLFSSDWNNSGSVDVFVIELAGF